MKAEADKTQEAAKWTHHRKSFELFSLFTAFYLK
jgi:hypothetical protein